MEETELKPVALFLSAIQNHVQILHKLDQQVVKPHYLDKYPLRDLLSFYQKQLIPKLQNRQKRSDVFSDILMWYTPNIIVLMHKVDSYIKNLSLDLSNTPVQTPQDLDLPQKSTIKVALTIPYEFMLQKMLDAVRQCSEQNVKQTKKAQAMQLYQFVTLLQKLANEQKNTDVSLPIEQFQSKIRSLLYPNIPNLKNKIAVKYSYRFLFIAKLKLRVKKANKRIHQRKMRIQQLIEGERKYINGLVDYIQYIKNPICKLDILTDLQKKKLFSSIESILGFHRFFEQQLTKKWEAYHKYQVFGDIIKKNIPFFKIYTDYIEYADQAQAILLKLQQTNEDVKSICAKFMLDKQKKASDELKQPTFRIARYGMIISEILKNTNNCHPDYALLKQAQKQISVNLSKINETVDTIAKRTRLFQLDQEFGTEERPIVNKQRNFIEQFHLRLISDNKMEPIFLFIFSDLVIIIDENRKVLYWLDIDSNFYARREQDNKTYRNIIKIYSSSCGFLTFTAGSEDRHYAKVQSIFKILKQLSKNNKDVDKLVYVHVIGTEQINTSTFNKYTQYIAQISYMNLRKFSRLRFSLMRAFVSKIQQFYKHDLGISLDQGLKDSWFYNYNSKTIEDRKRSIQQILQKMLNHNIIRSDPAFILNELGIQPNFLKTTTTSKLKKTQSHTEVPQSVIFRRSSEKDLREAETIMLAVQIKLGRNSYHDPEFIGKKVENQKFTIYVHTMVGQQPLAVQITELYTVEDVCFDVSNMLDLKTNRDFRLFHQVGKKQLRVLDHDQKIMKLFNFTKKQNTNSSGISLFNMLGAVMNLISSDPLPKLIFKKYYYLPQQIEHAQCKKDVTRLRLILYQVIHQIKYLKYNLTFEDYLLFLAVLIYVEYDGQVPQQTQTSYVLKVIPQKIFKIKNQTQQYWLQQCRPHLLWLKEQINKIIQHNIEKVKSKRIRHDSPVHFEHRHICSLLAINKIRSNVTFGSNLFYVQLTKETYDKLQKQGKVPVYNMWLAIKVQSLFLLSPSSKQIMLQISHKEIQRFVVETQGIIFKIESMAACQYSLNTYQPFEISELIKYYKCLAETTVELEDRNNEVLLAKTIQYQKQLDHYRSSYQKAERETMAETRTPRKSVTLQN